LHTFIQGSQDNAFVVHKILLLWVAGKWKGVTRGLVMWCMT
jgi:hypothetical protein